VELHSLHDISDLTRCASVSICGPLLGGNRDGFTSLDRAALSSLSEAASCSGIVIPVSQKINPHLLILSLRSLRIPKVSPLIRTMDTYYFGLSFCCWLRGSGILYAFWYVYVVQVGIDADSMSDGALPRPLVVNKSCVSTWSRCRG